MPLVECGGYILKGLLCVGVIRVDSQMNVFLVKLCRILWRLKFSDRELSVLLLLDGRAKVETIASLKILLCVSCRLVVLLSLVLGSDWVEH